MPRRSERRKTQKDAPVSGAGSSSGSNGSSVNKGNGKGKSGTNDSGSPGVRSLRPRPGKPKAPNGAKAGKEKVNRNGQKKKSPKKDSSSYISSTGEEYRPGGEWAGRHSRHWCTQLAHGCLCVTVPALL